MTTTRILLAVALAAIAMVLTASGALAYRAITESTTSCTLERAINDLC